MGSARRCYAPFTGKDHSVSFENVLFAYKKDEALHNISLSLKKGSLTALVGESGSGKSALARLLVHFCYVSGGAGDFKKCADHHPR